MMIPFTVVFRSLSLSPSLSETQTRITLYRSNLLATASQHLRTYAEHTCALQTVAL